MSLKMTKREHRERCIKVACGHVRCYLLTLKKLGCKMAAEDIERILDALERIEAQEDMAKQHNAKGLL